MNTSANNGTRPREERTVTHEQLVTVYANGILAGMATAFYNNAGLDFEHATRIANRQLDLFLADPAARLEIEQVVLAGLDGHTTPFRQLRRYGR